MIQRHKELQELTRGKDDDDDDNDSSSILGDHGTAHAAQRAYCTTAPAMPTTMPTLLLSPRTVQTMWWYVRALARQAQRLPRHITLQLSGVRAFQMPPNWRLAALVCKRRGFTCTALLLIIILAQQQQHQLAGTDEDGSLATTTTTISSTTSSLSRRQRRPSAIAFASVLHL